MPNINTILVETEDLGSFKVLLTDEQISILSENSANYLEKIKEELLEDNGSRRYDYIGSDYWMPDRIGTDDIEDGFTNNKVDWTSYFPAVTDQQIEDLIQDARKRELEIRLATSTGLVFLSVGITAALGGNPLATSAGFVQVIKVAGSYFQEKAEIDPLGG